MEFETRKYQQEAIEKGVEFFLDKKRENGIIVLPTGSGKAFCISSIADRLGENLLVFQPSKEILEQNLETMRTYTEDCSAYSASVGQKKVSKITFATIGSVKNHIDEFKHFKYIMVDECHGLGTDNDEGMYIKFLSMLDCKVLGLTATPYRLYTDTKFDYVTRKMTTVNARLLMLTQVPNPFFTRILYIVQNREMFDKGYLCAPTYYEVKPPRWNEEKMFANTSGSDFSSKSVQWMMEQSDMTRHLISICRRLLKPKDGKPRNGILVFTQFVEDAEEICANVAYSAYVCGTTTKKNRERIINEFKEGKIKVLVNVSALATGFNVPSLDTVVLGRPTLSMALYLQQVGRCVRRFDGKNAWVIDCVGNTKRFGHMENVWIGRMNGSLHEEVYGWVADKKHPDGRWKQLTGVPLKQTEASLFVK